MRKMILAAALAAVPGFALAQQQGPTPNLVQDWQSLQGADMARAGAMSHLLQDLNDMQHASAKDAADLAAEKRHSSDLQRQLDIEKRHSENAQDQFEALQRADAARAANTSQPHAPTIAPPAAGKH